MVLDRHARRVRQADQVRQGFKFVLSPYNSPQEQTGARSARLPAAQRPIRCTGGEYRGRR
jgi:hypothetical protein